MLGRSWPRDDHQGTVRRQVAGQRSGWPSDLDRRAVDHVRALAMDAVQSAGDGHPGTAMSLAPAAYLIFQEFLRHDPTDPDWIGRDRFVLSCGHSSLTLYIQLYLSGYGLTLEDLKLYRQWGSRDPGPPGARPHPRRRDHHRSARLRASPRRSAWPWRPAASAACTTPTPSRARASSTTPSGCSSPTVTWKRASPAEAQQPRRPPAARQPRRALRRQPHLDRGQHRRRLQRGRRRPLRGLRLARAGRRRLRGRRRAAQGAQGGSGRDRPPELHPDAQHHRASRRRTLQNTGKAHGSALGAEEVAATKEVMGLNPEARLRDARRRARPRARGRRPRPGRCTRRGTSATRTGARRMPAGARAARPSACPPAAGRLGEGAPGLPGQTRRAWRPARRSGEVLSARSTTCCPSCGAVPPTSRAATTRR